MFNVYGKKAHIKDLFNKNFYLFFLIRNDIT